MCSRIKISHPSVHSFQIKIKIHLSKFKFRYTFIPYPDTNITSLHIHPLIREILFGVMLEFDAFYPFPILVPLLAAVIYKKYI